MSTTAAHEIGDINLVINHDGIFCIVKFYVAIWQTQCMTEFVTNSPGDGVFLQRTITIHENGITCSTQAVDVRRSAWRKHYLRQPAFITVIDFQSPSFQ